MNARPPRIVHQYRVYGQRAQGTGDVGKDVGRVRAAPVEETRLSCDLRRQKAEAVVLQLEGPSIVVEGTFGDLGEHRTLLRRVDRALLHSESFQIPS